MRTQEKAANQKAYLDAMKLARRRKRQVQLRFTPADYEALEKRALAAGLSLPALCLKKIFG